MYETGIICLLILIIFMLFLVLIYCIYMYNTYTNDREEIQDTKDEVRRIAIAVLAKEGLSIPVDENSDSSKRRKKGGLFKLFN